MSSCKYIHGTSRLGALTQNSFAIPNSLMAKRIAGGIEAKFPLTKFSVAQL